MSMKIIQRVLYLEGVNYYKKHLSIVNSLLPTNLTNKEVEVLASFLSLDKSLIEEDMFNSESRKRVREGLKLSSGGLSNHLYSMITKGVLSKNNITNKISIKDFLIPEVYMQGYQIKIFKK